MSTPLSSLKRNLKFAALGAFLTAVVAIVSFWSCPAIRTKAAAAGVHRAEAPAATATAQPAQAALTEPLVPAARFPTVDSRPPAPTEIRQVLPGLAHSVTDWREYKPDKIAIAPYPDLAMEFEAASIREEEGRTLWRGRNALQGAFLVSAATENEWHAVLEIPGAGSFEFHISGQTVTIMDKSEAERCGTDFALRENAAATDVFTGSATASVQPTALALADTFTVDVLFFYDAPTLAANNFNSQTIATTIASRIEAANTILQNSQITNLRWRYVAAYQVPDFTPTGSLEDDLDRITFADNPVGQFVAEKAALHGVDQAVIYVSGNRDYSGIAWVTTRLTALAHHSAAVWNTGSTTLAHEMAHNFGCRHDRQQDAIEGGGAFDGDGKYWYGHRFLRNGVDTGTVMSYADSRVPYFSNPNVTFQGIPLGIAENQTKAAYNARVLRDNAQPMASYDDAPSPPAIASHPESTTVAVGGSFSLSVVATGTNLTYQWKKDGSSLSGATAATYSKSSAAESDAGSYAVTVSNIAGEATSDAATVTVTTSAASAATSTPSSSPASSGGGGGGGGGAVDVRFAAVGALLMALRCAWTPRRK